VTSSTRTRLIATSLLVLVAGAGFAAGIVAERFLIGSPAPALTADTPPRDGIRIMLRGETPAEGAGGVQRFIHLPGLAEALDLTAEQQAAIERILLEDQAAIRDMTNELEPALVAVVERSRQRIHEVLTDEQIARWQAMPRMRLRGVRSPEPD
jgi:hypothetical protein